MFYRIATRRVPLAAAVTVSALLVLVVTLMVKQAPAQASTAPADLASAELAAPKAYAEFGCPAGQIDHVAVVSAPYARVQLSCKLATAGGIHIFVAPAAADSATASRYLSLMTTAFVANKIIVFGYDDADLTSGPPIGCGNADCRVFTGLRIQ